MRTVENTVLFFCSKCRGMCSYEIKVGVRKMKKSYKELLSLTFAFMVVVILSYVLHSQSYVKEINNTAMAFSYEYGFISRGLIGTMYQLLDKVISIDMMTPEALFGFVHVVTMAFIIEVFLFFTYALRRCNSMSRHLIIHLSIGFAIWTVPTFVSLDGFGRLDIYCLSLSLIMTYLIISQKHEWLVPILSAISILIHHGNVFMFMNIPLVLLIYRILIEKKKSKRKHYTVLFVSTFVIVSVLFLYFEFFSHTAGQAAYEAIIEKAKNLSFYNGYHEGLVRKEILGISVAKSEVTFKLVNIVQLPIFIVIMLPQIITVCKVYCNVIRKSINGLDKFKYVCVFAGSITVVPELILKCDYGRYMYFIITYYAVMFISLITMDDNIITAELMDFEERLTAKSRIKKYVFYYYPFMLQPLYDVDIISLTGLIGVLLNENILHWW